MSTVNVALLYQTSQFESHLRDALRELGAAVVYEALAADVDRDALEGSGASVVIVNLDPEVESHLDEVYDLLGDERYNVLFNDATVSSSLQGWDQARWARHLAAKVLGKPEVVDPPRPAGAEAPRSPAERMAVGIPDFVAPAAVAPAPVEMVASTPSPYAQDSDLNSALDALLQTADAAPGPSALRPVQADPGEVTAPQRDVAPAHDLDLRAEFDATADQVQASPTRAPPPPGSAPDTFDFASELDSLLGDIPDATLSAAPTRAAPAPAEAPTSDDFAIDLGLGDLEAAVPTAAVAPRSAAPDEGGFAAELDALFAGSSAAAPAPAAEAEFVLDEGSLAAFDAATEAPFAAAEEDFPPLFDALDEAAPAAAPAPAAQPAPAARPAAAAAKGSFGALSLAPIDEEGEAAGATPAAPAAAPVAAKPTAESFGVKKLSAEDFLSGKDWSLENVEEEGEAAAAPPAAEVKVEKVAAQDFLAPEGGDSTKFNFDTSISLDLVPIEEAIAPEEMRRDVVVEHRLDEVSIGTPKGVVKRVIVLGASIGGPEAVRDYLAAIPARFPALFLLAQHMGAEFLELMSAQLAKVTPLTVRTPTHGERVGHGDVIVVPTDKRLVVDADGVVQLRPLTESSPYSPSIDLVLHDIADEFGPKATAIVFSGMAHDAIEGSKYLAAKGGQVWVQDPDTCVISSMVDGAIEAGVVNYNAGPAQLARHTLDEYAK